MALQSTYTELRPVSSGGTNLYFAKIVSLEGTNWQYPETKNVTCNPLMRYNVFSIKKKNWLMGFKEIKAGIVRMTWNTATLCRKNAVS